MTSDSGGLKQRVKGIAHWVKVVLLVVLITLLVVLVLQNLEEEATLKFVVPEWHTKVSVVVALSFVTGVLMTLLVVFLRRGSQK